MTSSDPIPKDLIAPCGMNCALCSKYLAYINHLKRSQCSGCRSNNTPCTRCGYMVSVHNGKCFQCDSVTKLVKPHKKP